MTKVLLTPTNDLIVVREFLWAGESLEDAGEYSIKIGYSDCGPMYLAWYKDNEHTAIIIDQQAVDRCDDLGEL